MGGGSRLESVSPEKGKKIARRIRCKDEAREDLSPLLA